MKTLLFAIILFLFAPATFAADTTLVPTGATWKYLANGTDQGTAWRATSFKSERNMARATRRNPKCRRTE